MFVKRMNNSLILIALLTLTGCADDASVASQNLSKAADMFEIERRVVFLNGITDRYILTIEGRCSIKHATTGLGENVRPKGQLAVTCKTGDAQFKKHFLGLSDNVTYFAEQIEPAGTDVYHYRVIFKPEAIIPNIDVEVSQ